MQKTMNQAKAMDEEMDIIDDSLYSRQRYVLGDRAMHQMAQSSVFLSGLGGLGVEIAKNIILAGLKSVVIHDPAPSTLSDLSSQFFLRPDDVSTGTSRAEASLSRLQELNPYVSVSMVSQPLTTNSDLSFLSQYQCVILTDASVDLQLVVNKFCRAQQPPVKFLSCSVRGVFSSLFCDFGPEFTVYDKDGEEPLECFIGNITKASPGVVTCLEGHLHGMSTGDLITFREVVGMEVNGTTHTIKVMSPSVFSVGDTSEMTPYQHGGIVRQRKTQSTVTFEPLEVQLRNPSVLIADFAKFEHPLQTHIGLIALDRFSQTHNGSLPKPRDPRDAMELARLANEVNRENKLVELVDEELLKALSFTAGGLLPPLATVVGGLAAQEALIALTGKFSPLKQWLYLDAVEVLSGQESLDSTSFLPKGDRYDAVRICLGEELLQKMANCRLFMVGCGAIGCEMLKNYAMLGIGRRPAGQITITDNDLIEKSNLNRQFLFRPRHIQQPKSLVAARSTNDINPELLIDPQQYKVFPGTERKVYHDQFFQSQTVIVNALDNVEARRYVDSRCVTNLRPLLESGTMGAKGHVQVIVPHLTESYSSQQDPPDKDVPYCTLKSFPATIEHTIQWARDKFEALFFQKPSMYTKFWDSQSPQKLLQALKEQQIPDGVVKVVKMLGSSPRDWTSCVQLGRIKFEKYFNHKALNLIHTFPLDTKMKDGSLFWQSPKRPPIPVVFSASNKQHMLFVMTTAKLLASIHGIQYTDQDLLESNIVTIIQSTPVPLFKPSSKTVITDESVKKPEQVEVPLDMMETCQANLEKMLAAGDIPQQKLRMFPQAFEKDDDSNGHIDFISSAANLRASVYSIENVDRLKAKLIAGRIVPAIATTTAAVAGLVSIELIKVIQGGLPLESYKNAFLSLALPSLVFSEPAPPLKTLVNKDLSFSLWDRWEVKGHKDMTLQEFLNILQEQCGLEVTMVVLGVKMIYVPFMPGHKKRLTQTMVKLLKPDHERSYMDLTVSLQTSTDEDAEDAPGPPVRYYFK